MAAEQVPRLAQLYYSSDRTVQAAVASWESDGEDAEMACRSHPATDTTQQAVLVEYYVYPRVLYTAKQLAGGDLGRLVFREGGGVFVCNSRGHARLVREDVTYGMGE